MVAIRGGRTRSAGEGPVVIPDRLMRRHTPRGRPPTASDQLRTSGDAGGWIDPIRGNTKNAAEKMMCLERRRHAMKIRMDSTQRQTLQQELPPTTL